MPSRFDRKSHIIVVEVNSIYFKERTINMDLFEKGVFDRFGRELSSEEKPFCGGECPQPKGKFPAETPLGMAYVPFQEWEKTYDAQAALSRGTVFPSLDKPFIGEEAVKGECKK